MATASLLIKWSLFFWPTFFGKRGRRKKLKEKARFFYHDFLSKNYRGVLDLFGNAFLFLIYG
jgi:hypothetical protein